MCNTAIGNDWPWNGFESGRDGESNSPCAPYIRVGRRAFIGPQGCCLGEYCFHMVLTGSSLTLSSQNCLVNRCDNIKLES
jgi:hypothetical protein